MEKRVSLTSEETAQVALCLMEMLKPMVQAQIEERLRAVITSWAGECAEITLRRKIERLIEVDVRVNKPRRAKASKRKR